MVVSVGEIATSGSFVGLVLDGDKNINLQKYKIKVVYQEII